MSSETLGKNLIRHPEIGFDDYRRLQEVYQGAQLVVNDTPNTLIFYYETDSDFFSVVKATLTGDKMYMTSFRKASRQSIDNIKNRGRTVKDEL